MREEFDFLDHVIFMSFKIFDKEKNRIIMKGFAKGFDLLIFLHLISNLNN